MSETDVSREIAKALEQLGCKVIRLKAGQRGRRNIAIAKGTPDRVVLTPSGSTVWLEVKLPGEELRPDQRDWFAWAAKHGHCAVVATSIQEAVTRVRRASEEMGKARNLGESLHLRGG